MCEFAKLVAWLDGELPDSEAVEVGQHVRECRACRERLAMYKDVSGMVGAYCDASLAANAPSREIPTWVPALGAAAALLALLAVFPHFRGNRSPTAFPTETVSGEQIAAAATTPSELQKAPVRVNRKTRRSSVTLAEEPHSQRQIGEIGVPPAGPAIEIAIPGEAVFPPGALPPGIGFVADFSMAEDGSAQRLRLRPELTGFEGGVNQ